MRRLTLMAGVLCVALLTSTGAFTQVPPNPDNPNDTVSDTLAPPPYGEPINLATAKKVADAAAAEAAKRKWDAFCIAIVGPSGDLVYFEKLDNCHFASVTISQHKARIAFLVETGDEGFEINAGVKAGPPCNSYADHFFSHPNQ